MEFIAPPLKLLQNVKKCLEKGQSCRQGIILYTKGSPNQFTQTVLTWHSHLQQGLDTQEIYKELRSHYRRSLLMLLERGLRGESIYTHLCLLEDEILVACHEEMTQKISKMPFILLIPMLLFQFPAILMLLFGPLLQNFFHSLGSG